MKYRLFLLCTIVAVLLLGCNSESSNNSYTVSVQADGVMDGIRAYLNINEGGKIIVKDSAIVSNGQFEFKGQIDAPEMNQPYGAQSKNFLNRLLYEKEVTLIAQGEDRYGRVLGNLFSNELNVNMLMVKFGFAWVYDKYAKNSSLYKYQDQAKAENLGLWRAKDPIAPWVWRKQK